MAWTEFTRRRYERSGGKYASDATDAEWALIAPLMPAVRWTGRPRTTDLREVFNAILTIATTGCQWRMLPSDFPSVSTVRRYFYDWRDNGLLRELNRQLVAELLSNLVFEGCWSCGNLAWFGFNSVFEFDACDDFGEVVKAA